jgi:GDSL-like Lipase/Acylhydrolase family
MTKSWRPLTRPCLLATVAFCALAAAAFTSITVSRHLREIYSFTVPHWMARIRRPNAVFVGDSITAGGGQFGHLANINMGRSGLLSYQIAEQALVAYETYEPRHLFIMAGTNDILAMHFRPKETQQRLAAMVERLAPLKTRVVLTLIPHTSRDPSNARIEPLNAYLRGLAEAAHFTVIDMNPILAPHGILLPNFTTDGVHLSSAAYLAWNEEIEGILTSMP